jgi:class 3 adenylate cyclase
VVKTIEAELMGTLPSADAAAAAAIEFRKQVSDAKTIAGVPIEVRVGFHFGDVILKGGEPFGDTVSIAGAMRGKAKPGQILTTGPTVERLAPAWRSTARRIDGIVGKHFQIDVYELAAKS